MFIGIANCCAIVEYGNEANPLIKASKSTRSDDTQDQPMEGSEIVEEPCKVSKDVLSLNTRTLNIVLRRFGDVNILPYFHVNLVFIFAYTFQLTAMAAIETSLPWKLISVVLNTLSANQSNFSSYEDSRFPQSDNGDLPRPLPEDFAMRGLLWVERYFPVDWFSNDKIDDDEKYFEVASMTDERKGRILWLGYQIAKLGRWLRYDHETRQFSVPPEYELDIDDVPVPAGQDATPESESKSRVPTFASATTATDHSSTWGSQGGAEDLMDTDEAPVTFSP
jgi:hypothetical protein